MRRMLLSYAIAFFAVAALSTAQTTVSKQASKKPGPAEQVQSGNAQTRPATTQKVEDMMDSFQTMERGFWDAWKKKDAKPFEQFMAPNSLIIDNTGIADKATAIKGIAGCEVKSYELSDFKLTKIDAANALLTYKAGNIDAVCDGQKAPTSVFASTVFSKSGGKWWMLFHQESAAVPNESAK